MNKNKINPIKQFPKELNFRKDNSEPSLKKFKNIFNPQRNSPYRGKLIRKKKKTKIKSLFSISLNWQHRRREENGGIPFLTQLKNPVLEECGWLLYLVKNAVRQGGKKTKTKKG